MPSRYRFIFLNSSLKGKRHTMEGGTLLIGHHPSCGLMLPNEKHLAEKHVEIRLRRNKLYICALDPLYAVKVNRRYIQEEKLVHGDIIECGPIRFQFRELHTTDPSFSRKNSRFHAVSISAVALILLSQVIILIGLSLGRAYFKNKDKKSDLALTTVSTNDLPIETQSIVAQITNQPLPKLSRKTVLVKRKQKEKNVLKASKEERAKELITLTKKEINLQHFQKADKYIQQALQLLPGYLPAYVERARLFELQGQLNKASTQWDAVLKRSKGTPLYVEASEERMRIAKLQLQQTSLLENKPVHPLSALVLKRIGFQRVEQVELGPDGAYDEIRILSFTLKSRASEVDITEEDMRAEITFFDQAKESGTILHSRAMAPREPLWILREGEKQISFSGTAAYLVPRAFREAEQKEYGEGFSYYGFKASLYYLDELQDEWIEPGTLMISSKNVTRKQLD